MTRIQPECFVDVWKFDNGICSQSVEPIPIELIVRELNRNVRYGFSNVASFSSNQPPSPFLKDWKQRD